jgi:hypothetical protein
LQDLGFIPTHFVTFFIGMLVRFIWKLLRTEHFNWPSCGKLFPTFHLRIEPDPVSETLCIERCVAGEESRFTPFSSTSVKCH